MRKKQPKNDPEPIGMDVIGETKPHERLNIRELRRLVDELRTYLSKNTLPDWSEMPHWHRFAVVLRLLPQDQRETLLGRSDKQLARYEGGVEVPFAVVAALAVETEVPLDWIATGKPPQSGQTVALESSGAPPTATIFATDDVSVAILSSPNLQEHGSVSGSTRSIRFPRAILARIGVEPEDARILEALGDGMKPTISDGDLLVVDISHRQIAEGMVYAFSIGGVLNVKRLRQLGDRVLMMSDNKELFPAEEAVPVDQPFHIIGRVKWAGRAL